MVFLSGSCVVTGDEREDEREDIAFVVMASGTKSSVRMGVFMCS